MKIAVDCGHCPKSTGASGYLDELTEDRKIGKALVDELKARGHKVIDVTPADSEAESFSGRARRANNAAADFFVSIHLNAGGGTGTEVYTTSTSGAKNEAKRTSAAVAEVLGLKNRGHKTANYTVLVKTDMPAMLVEVCFVDTSKDAEAYRATTPGKIAAAIADGILGESKGVVATETTTSATSTEKAAPAASKAGLEIDGLWGNDTTKAVQKALGTPVDGIVSGQNTVDLASVNKGGLRTSSWKVGSGGSQMVKALQKKVGADADGYFGKKTCKALQKHLGTTADGCVSKPSAMVKELQRRLNKGTF